MSGTRKIVTRAPHRRVGLIACAWFQPKPIEYESLLERDYARKALLDLCNTSIEHQPFHINLETPYKRYTPDYLLRRGDKKLVIEVKPREIAQSEKNRARLQHVREILADTGYDFVVETEESIRADRVHERAGLLLRYARSHLPAEITNRVIEIASAHPDGITIDDLAVAADVPTSIVLHLVGRRMLRIDASLYMDGGCMVYPLGGA
jgi:hypothetical protein